MKAKIYFEIIGKDKTLIKDFANKILDRVKESKEIKIINSNIAEPIETEKEFPDPRNQNNKIKVKLLSSYIEIQSEFENLEKLLYFIANYAPSNIEIEDLKEVELIYNDYNEKINGMKFSELLSILSNKIIELSILNGQLYLSYMNLYKMYDDLKKKYDEMNKNKDQKDNKENKQ